jgi:hypothetical protein
MSCVAEGRVNTVHGRKYAAQLAKHWAHNLNVEERNGEYRVTFPRNARGMEWPGDAVVTLAGGDRSLRCRIEATAEGQCEGLKGAVARHLDRFAFREAPLPLEWGDQ